MADIHKMLAEQEKRQAVWDNRPSTLTEKQYEEYAELLDNLSIAQQNLPDSLADPKRGI